MDILIFVLKATLVLAINIGFGYLISYCFHAFFFYPKKVYIFAKYPLAFTPGLLHRKKKQLLDYINTKLEEYYTYVNNDYFEKNFLTDFENKIHDEVYPYILKFLEKDWMPAFVKEKLEHILSDILWMIIYKLTRTVFPKILHDIKIDRKIELLDIKLDIYKLRELFEKHIYKYLLYFNLAFFTVIGLLNMLLFIILA